MQKDNEKYQLLVKNDFKMSQDDTNIKNNKNEKNI